MNFVREDKNYYARLTLSSHGIRTWVQKWVVYYRNYHKRNKWTNRGEALQGVVQVQQWPDLSCFWSPPVPSDHLNRWSPKLWTKWTLLSLCRHWWTFYIHFTGVAQSLGEWSLGILSKDEKGSISSWFCLNVQYFFGGKFSHPSHLCEDIVIIKYTVLPCRICFLLVFSLILVKAQLVASSGGCAPLCTWVLTPCMVTHL